MAYKKTFAHPRALPYKTAMKEVVVNFPQSYKKMLNKSPNPQNLLHPSPLTYIIDVCPGSEKKAGCKDARVCEGPGRRVSVLYGRARGCAKVFLYAIFVYKCRKNLTV